MRDGLIGLLAGMELDRVECFDEPDSAEVKDHAKRCHAEAAQPPELWCEEGKEEIEERFGRERPAGNVETAEVGEPCLNQADGCSEGEEGVPCAGMGDVALGVEEVGEVEGQRREVERIDSSDSADEEAAFLTGRSSLR